MKRKLSPPSPLRPRSKLGSWGTNKIYYIGIPIQQVKKEKKTSSWHLNRFPDADNIGSTV